MFGHPRVAHGCSKIFGPVLVVSKFETEGEVIELANNTKYGLGAGFHSRMYFLCPHRRWEPFRMLFLITYDYSLVLPSWGIYLGDANQCQRVLAKLEAGTVWVNQYGILYNNVRTSYSFVSASGLTRNCSRMIS